MTGTAGMVLDDDAQQTFEHAIGALASRDLAFLHLTALMPGPHLNSAERTTAMGRHYRSLFSGPLIINSAMTREAAETAIAEGAADFVAFGKPFIANPDLVERFRDGRPLAEPDPTALYSGGAKGYLGYATATPEAAIA